MDEEQFIELKNWTENKSVHGSDKTFTFKYGSFEILIPYAFVMPNFIFFFLEHLKAH
jgi:hypothetical protein